MGSSIINTSGSCNNTLAMPTRCLNPRESLPIGLLSTVCSAHCSITWEIRSLLVAGSILLASPKKLSRAMGVISSYNGPFSGRYPIRFATTERLFATSKPHTLAIPADGAKYPVSIFIVVLFPAPFGPRKATTSPLRMEMFKSSTAIKSP